jgi:Prenyltransferase and squalene oxidase repeat
MIEAALDLVLGAQNPDGGWGSIKGRHSNTESTSFALMALRSLGGNAFERQISAGLGWLRAQQNADGSWRFNEASKQSSWTTPLAVLALVPFQDQREQALRAAKWLLTQKGRKPGWIASLLVQLALVKKRTELDPFLTGWSWTPGSFSWVEPTSYSLIALKKLRSLLVGTEVEERIRQGETLIYDRICDGGGWNYGNSKVLGEALWPYPDITAVALIALSDHAASSANRASLDIVARLTREAASGLALGWGIICLRLYEKNVGELRKLLAESFEKTRFLGETKTIALAVLALGEGANFFRVRA